MKNNGITKVVCESLYAFTSNYWQHIRKNSKDIKLSRRLCLVHVKYFPENKYFPEMLFSGKENIFRLFGCLRIHFTENQFWCLVRSNILQKMLSVLQKINSHVWFGQTFYGKWNSFYGNSIPMFGLFKHFTENMKCLTKLSTCIT